MAVSCPARRCFLSTVQGNLFLPCPGADLLVLNLVGAYWRYAQEYYQGHEKALNFIKQCLKPLRKQCRNMPAVSFGPKALKELRENLIDQTGNSRGTINRKVNRIVEVFRWAVESEMLVHTENLIFLVL